ncbi:hypothetical protein GOP47_0003118 [Adiantum capillus-veneris]|uniref:E3 SUMO-protein ligase SIZ1 n=1 Tax=Adiantum capillus-veneris TaxID=13818 RepID=A0A9D4VC76_ADICA|nr:hypothetical protein GOP47_0003118 [Adiantum capillus-veneris]
MDRLSLACLEKLETFRIKELKDVLTRIGAAKQGKRQVLIDKVMAIVSAPERQPAGLKGSRPESSTKYNLSREEVAKIIDDVYRKMRGSSALDLATAGDILAGLRTSNQSGTRGESVTRCPCGSKMTSESMIQCDNPKCMVWQHINCVLIPEKEGLKAEHPPQFYCELCRIQFGDPYCVAVSHPLLPVKMITSFPASEGSNPLQNVEKSFLVTRSDQEMLMKPQYDIQVWSLLLDDKVAFRMHWPLHSELRINGYPIRATNRPTHQSLGINGRDDGVGISDLVREGSNSISMSADDGKPFCIGVRIIQRLSVEQVLSRIPGEVDGESFDTALARVRRCIGGGNGQIDNGNDSDSDLEVISECVFVNLRCPMSGSRMKMAGRFKHCVHMGCFDLHTFVELNQRTRKWQCPICLTNYSLDELIIDPFLTRIVKAMKSYGEDVVEVEMKPDGHWRPKVEGDTRLQEAWRSPEGMLIAPPTSNRLELKPVKIEEGLPFDKVPLKIGIKRTRDGTWQVKQTNGGLGLPKNGNGVNDQHLMFSSAEFSRSSSMTANTTEAFSARHERDGIIHMNRTADAEVNSVPTEAPVNLHQPVGSATADSESRRNEEVIILSDTEEENVGECNLGEDIVKSVMLPAAIGVQNREPMEERELDADITFLDVEPLQECTVDFFESNRGDSIPQDSWLSQVQDPPFELMGSAPVLNRKGFGHQRPRSHLTQTGRKPSRGSGHDQHRRNGMPDSRALGYERTGHYQEKMVETARESVSTDQSLHLFLPPQPAKALVQRRVNDPNPASEDGLQDGWFSLSLGSSERMAESRPTGRASPFSSEEASQERFDHVADQASGLLNLNSQGTSARLDSSFTHRRTPGVAIHRSSHRPRSYFRVDSDSDR